MTEAQERRLRRKLEARDIKIAGLRRRCRDLEAALAARVLEAQTIPRDIARAVQAALCNVRMIPVHGVGKCDRIVDVRAHDAAD